MWIPGPKLTQVFASRWKALLWAAGILVSAYCFVPRQGEHDDNAAAIALAKGAMPGEATQPGAAQPDSSQTALSPWAAKSSNPAAH